MKTRFPNSQFPYLNCFKIRLLHYNHHHYKNHDKGTFSYFLNGNFVFLSVQGCLQRMRLKRRVARYFGSDFPNQVNLELQVYP